jgi:hypothetical protein
MTLAEGERAETRALEERFAGWAITVSDGRWTATRTVPHQGGVTGAAASSARLLHSTLDLIAKKEDAMPPTAPTRSWRGDDPDLITHSPDGESRGLMF